MEEGRHPAPRSIMVRAFTRYQGKTIHIKPCFVGETHIVLGGTLRISLMSLADRKEYHSETLRHLGLQPIKTVSFTIGDDLPFAACQIKAQFTDRNGVSFETEVLHDRAVGEFPWLGSSAGVNRKVPSPWVPLVCRDVSDRSVSVECWGRSYVFDGVSFIREIRSAGKDILARPIRLVARVDGAEVAWEAGNVDLVVADPDQAILRQEIQSAQGISVRARAEMDFDGVLRCDCAIESQREVRLESLEMEIAIPERHARYLYFYPGRWGTVKNAGALPREQVTLPFKPYLWLGDEDRGLAWFSESSRNWYSDAPERVMNIRREGETVVLSLRMVSVPITIKPGSEGGVQLTGTGIDRSPAQAQSAPVLRYSFGIQATPVKPVKENAWDHRIFCILQGTKGFMPRLTVSDNLLDELVKAGVRTVMLTEHWSDAEGYVKTPHRQELKRIVADCHARGLKLILYFSFLISDIVEEWGEIGKDCIITPKSGYPVYSYAPQPLQAAWRVCLNSQWQDLLVEGIARALDEYDLDGVYLDGTELPMACCNTEHGCGKIGADGSISPTYPIWGVRSALRRIYDIVRSRRPDGIVNIHNSTCMTMPTLGWATSYWDGEQFQNVQKGTDVESLIPLDAFRAEFMGRQWGVASEFLFAGEAYTYREAWSFALLHDVPVRAYYTGEQLELQAMIWKAMDEFGRGESEWLPYWSNGEYLKVSPDGVHASVYRHPRNGILMVLSNCTKAPKEVMVKLDPSRLRFPGGFSSASDALEGEAVTLEGSSLRFQLPPYGWKLIRIQG